MKRKIKVGNMYIGGDAPITIQSMTNTLTEDAVATIKQINELSSAGCDIVRCAVNTPDAADALKVITSSVSTPIVADIQFDYKLAILSAKAGASKIRINPSNIGSEDKVRELIAVVTDLDIPIRIGVNGGSIERDIFEKYGKSGTALAESALKQAAVLEKYGFYNTIISVKSSNCSICYDAYSELDSRCDYPLHLGVTEAGGGALAVAKSNIVIGGLLQVGIGNTIRVSLSEAPVEEVKAALNILRALGIRKDFVEVISCPTCARTEFDVIGVSKALSEKVKDIRKNIKIAVMGCIVNGIGEGEDADFGVAGGKDKSILFAKGRRLKTIDNYKVLEYLLSMAEEYNG